ncbi:MAG: amidase, partial [Saprospiraceae bacterium]
MPKFESIEKLQQNLLEQNTNCLDVVKYYISRIEENKELNAFVEVFEEEAIAVAKKLDEKIQHDSSSLGKLFGIVISVKDNICIKGKEVTAASNILEGFESTFTATAIQKLLDEDAIIIGRTNCDEFAMGSANSNSKYGATRNAANPNHVPGGSSGGSAVSVQADCCLISIGSDTGGSVRQPAGFCGVVGFKPSYGRISRYGLLAYASSFDQIGILAHSVKDVALVSEIMYGHDKMDATSSQREVPTFNDSLKQSLNTSKKIACFSGILNNEEIDI